MIAAHLLRKYNPAEWGGTETALQRLCAGLHRHDVSSVVFCPEIPQRTADDPLVAAGCVVKRFRACVPVWGVSSAQRQQMVAVGGNLMSFDLIGALWREPGVAVVHAHTLGRIGAIGRMVARWRGLPFVCTTHGGVYDLPPALSLSLNARETQGWEWGRICGLLLRTRQLLSTADAVITCNPREAELMRERHPAQRVVVQPHGVPTEQFLADHRAAARKAFPALVGRTVLLAVGRIDAVKNQAWLIEQLPGLIHRHPMLLLVLAGASTDQDYTEALVKRIRELGLHSHVLLTGGLPPGDPSLIGLMQEARAVVLPSVSETFGLVILEAWAAGAAVISSRTSGAMSLIESRHTGLLFDLSRPDEFHAGIDLLWTDVALTARLAASGRRRAVADFDTTVFARRMKQLYENLIEEKYAHRHSA
jgi:starch synthase